MLPAAPLPAVVSHSTSPDVEKRCAVPALAACADEVVAATGAARDASAVAQARAVAQTSRVDGCLEGRMARKPWPFVLLVLRPRQNRRGWIRRVRETGASPTSPWPCAHRAAGHAGDRAPGTRTRPPRGPHGARPSPADTRAEPQPPASGGHVWHAAARCQRSAHPDGTRASAADARARARRTAS